jgi:hypothetical protein
MIHRTEIAITRAIVSAAIPPMVSARNGSSIIGANAAKQHSFPGNQMRRARRAEDGIQPASSPKHPEDHEQIDHSPNYHCLYDKARQHRLAPLVEVISEDVVSSASEDHLIRGKAGAFAYHGL